MNELYRKAIDKFGSFDQIIKTVEELGELSAAIARYSLNPTEETTKAVIEEIADVEIMCEQLDIIFTKDAIETVKSKKLKRLEKMLEEETNVHQN